MSQGGNKSGSRASVSRRFILAAPSLLGVPAIKAQEKALPDLQQAREQVARNAEALAKAEVPRATEPAFRFEA